MDDPRIPVELGTGPVSGGQAWLIDGDTPAPPGPVERFNVSTAHAPGCACCLPRSAAAEALRRLFLRRARGDVVFFDRVIALPSGAAAADAIRDALQQDVFVAARYRAARER